MKSCIPFMLLFFVTGSVCFSAKGQSAVSVKAAKIDSSEKDVTIVCFHLADTIPSEYPDGAGAWSRFLAKHLKFPAAYMDSAIHETVVVQFVIGPDGKVTEIEALSGPMELRQQLLM
ncbi:MULTISPECIES: energy transducer TonB [Niastella]|uniref:TonB C-terminal domain-containing protein n=1 Tax=Niastella soli TaxID=2821487 RepID=A0ABS3YZG8_9BACT|nr:hypothetical protein [Niastella soli]MBO9203339.1 hypothetical protein [Niastella soli]